MEGEGGWRFFFLPPLPFLVVAPWEVEGGKLEVMYSPPDIDGEWAIEESCDTGDVS